MNVLLSNATLAVSELKKNPMVAIKENQLCILNRNAPAFYTVTPERMAELLKIESEFKRSVKNG